MIYETFDAEELAISENELSARLRAPKGAYSGEVLACIKRVKKSSSPAVCALKVPVRHISESTVYIEGTLCESSALAKLLLGCEEALLICATLGFSVERLLREYSLRSPSVHFMLDAAADALVEALCDKAEERILCDVSHTARFSPGYADLPLSFTSQIIKITGAEKFLGVKLCESFLATPSKTVTAVIGIREDL